MTKPNKRAQNLDGPTRQRFEEASCIWIIHHC